MGNTIITGGAGFLGQHVVNELKLRGIDPYVVRSEKYDLRRYDDIWKLFHHHNPDVIIHLAAVVGGIGANRERPADFFYDNLMMGVQLMHHAAHYGVRKFVTIGTVCAYPKYTPVPFREDHLWEGYPEETNAPYGLAKKMLLVQGQAYHKQYGLNSIYLLPTNLYGPGDNFDSETSHVIPALIRKCLEAKATNADHITVWGTGTATRDFLYVTDAARAIVDATLYYDHTLAMNIGSGQEVSIGELVYVIAKVTGFKGAIIWDSDKPDGQPRRVLDISRAKSRIGFEPAVSLYDGLQRTVEWYQEQTVYA